MTKSTKRPDVLNLEWHSSRSRDQEGSILIVNYLRMRGYSVIQGSVFDGYRLIDLHRPRLLYISSAVGGVINDYLVRYAAAKGVICVTGYAEGNFQHERLDKYLWRVGQEGEFPCFKRLVWSDRAKKLFVNAYPEFEGRLAVTGAPAVDKYKIGVDDFMAQAAEGASEGRGVWLQGAEYDLVVGIGCWNFDAAAESIETQAAVSDEPVGDVLLRRLERERDLFELALAQAASKLSDVLFLVKPHPSSQGDLTASGVAALTRHPNVKTVEASCPVFDCIMASDLWVSYESATALEAWLAGKPTVALNPTSTDFFGVEGYNAGQPVVSCSSELQNIIMELRRTGCVDDFEKLSSERLQMISDVVGFGDGLNHVRVAKELQSVLEHSEVVAPEHKNVPLRIRLDKFKKQLVWWAIQTARWPAPNWLKRRHAYVSRFSERELFEETASLKIRQQKFYSMSTDELETLGMALEDQSLHINST